MTIEPAADNSDIIAVRRGAEADVHRKTQIPHVAGHQPHDASDGGVSTEYGAGGYADDPGLPYERRPQSDDPVQRRDSDSGSS